MLTVFSWDAYVGEADALDLVAWVRRPVPVVCEQWPAAGKICVEYQTVASLSRSVVPTESVSIWEHELQPGDVLFSRLFARSGECRSG